MSRKSILLGAGIILVILGGVGTILALLVTHEPSFFHRCEVPAGPVRQQHSRDFLERCSLLISNIKLHNPKWFQHFTDAQVNSYLREQFLRGNLDRALLPENITDPRLVFEPDRVRLAFRYGEGKWSTVVSVDLHAWLAKKEPNVVCLELLGLHAGSLPISAQALLSRILEGFQGKSVKVDWYRYNGHPCAVLHLRTDGDQPVVQLTNLELRQGMLVLGFRSAPQKSLSFPPPELRAELTPSRN